jgi:hypothetical protein
LPRLAALGLAHRRLLFRFTVTPLEPAVTLDLTLRAVYARSVHMMHGAVYDT